MTIGLMYGFDRLVKKMDRIAENIDEEVIIQVGETIYAPKNARYFRFASKEDMDMLYERSRIVVCHAGVGSILIALEHKKPVIAVPRRKKYEEHIDDHQLDIAGELEKEGLITVVHDVEALDGSLKNSSNVSRIMLGSRNILAKKLKEYVYELEKVHDKKNLKKL
ncbi:MAG: beta-1,4-galactosyltransferase [Candidatus Omnitrophica bacterium]|nr:beta-1,4-galactosyltransferase [Candidatus Omnitrophota bacterium]